MRSAGKRGIPLLLCVGGWNIESLLYFLNEPTCNAHHPVQNCPEGQPERLANGRAAPAAAALLHTLPWQAASRSYTLPCQTARVADNRPPQSNTLAELKNERHVCGYF